VADAKPDSPDIKNSYLWPDTRSPELALRAARNCGIAFGTIVVGYLIQVVWIACTGRQLIFAHNEHIWTVLIGDMAICGLAGYLGLALICVPRVPVENTENCRSSFHNLRILRKFLFVRTRPFFLRKSRAIPFSKTACERYFFGKFQRFSRNRNRVKINALRGRHPCRSGKTPYF
jgi:hypothetical protein